MPAEPLAPLVGKFLDYLTARAVSPQTLTKYEATLDEFITSIRAPTGVPATLADFDVPQIRRFLAAGHGKVKATTISSWYHVFKSFGRFLMRRGIVDENPAAAVRPPRCEHLLPKSITVDQASQMFAACDDSPDGVRERAILSILYGAGLRVSELCALNLDDIAGVQIRIRAGKGRKDRVTVATGDALQALDEWLRLRPLFVHPRTGEQDPAALFLSERGRRLEVRRVRVIVAEAGTRAGFKLHPHALRTACATHLLDAGADLRFIAELLGHASIMTTQRYTALSMDRLTVAHTGAHPHAR